jgi:hypothetical protein
MKIKFILLVLLLMCLATLVQSCGSGGAGASGSAVILTTSNVTANANPSSIDADIAPDTATGTIHKDTVSVTISSIITSKTGPTPLPVQVNSVTVSYVAKNGGPVLASETYNIGNTFSAGSVLTIPVDAATLNQKAIINSIYTGTTVDYDVSLIFNVSEVGFGGSSGSPVTHTFIHFANFKDS